MSRNTAASVFGICGSIALHLAVFAYGALYLTTPDLGFEIELPNEIEFGLTDEAVVAAGAPSTAPPTVAPQAAEADEPQAEGDVAVDASVAHADTSVADAGVAHDAAAVAQADTGPARSEEEGAGGDEEEGETRLPAGAQIALRLDMARIRVSPLAPEVRRLLMAIPDWRAVLDGSEINPLDDLDRVLIASPNLQRSRMILAGRYEPSKVDVDAVVARMAAARSVQAPWSTEGGVAVAPWANADETERVLAKVGPTHFTITRPEDLPRILAVARVRAEEQAQEAEEEGQEAEPTGADALLSMEEGEALSVEVEGARRFVRGMTRGVPLKIRLSVEEGAEGTVHVRAWGEFESEAAASEAVRYWRAMAEQASRNAIVRMLGFHRPLTDLAIEAEEMDVHAETALGPRQIRTVLDYLRGELEARERRRREREAAQSPPPPPIPQQAP